MVRAAASVFLAGILSQLSPGSSAALSPAARPGLRDARAVFIQTAPAPGARCAKVWVGREPELEEYLRQARIGYTNLSISGTNSVVVRLRDASQTEQARQLLVKLAMPVQSTSGLGFGSGPVDMELTSTPDGQLRMTLSEPALLERARNAVTQSIEIVRRRIDQTGVSEPTIQRQGADRILVQLPGIDDPERIKRLLGTTAKLTFRMVDVGADPNAPAPPGSEILEGDGAQGRAERYVVKRKVEVAGDNLVDAQAGYDQRSGVPVVNFRFDTVGGKRFAEITQQAVGLPFAIVLDNKVLSAPTIREPILGGSGQISVWPSCAGAFQSA